MRKQDQEPTIDAANAEKELHKKAKKVSDKDVEDIFERQEEIRDKLKDVPGKFGKMVNQVKLLLEMVADYWNKEYRELPWYTIAMAVSTLVYFVSPIDLLPDFIPVLGYADDAMVVGLAIRIAQEDLRAYCKFKQYDPTKYFDG